jgi:hypothetical protein
MLELDYKRIVYVIEGQSILSIAQPRLLITAVPDVTM